MMGMTWADPRSGAAGQEIPDSCAFCGEPLHVAEHFGRSSYVAGVFTREEWVRLACRCRYTEIEVRKEDLR